MAGSSRQLWRRLSRILLIALVLLLLLPTLAPPFVDGFGHNGAATRAFERWHIPMYHHAAAQSRDSRLAAPSRLNAGLVRI